MTAVLVPCVDVHITEGDHLRQVAVGFKRSARGQHRNHFTKPTFSGPEHDFKSLDNPAAWRVNGKPERLHIQK